MRLRIPVVALVALIVIACAFSARAQGLQSARPGESLLLLDETVCRFKGDAVFDGRRLRITNPVPPCAFTVIEAGNGYTYNSTTRVLIGDSRLFADRFGD